MTVKIDDIEFDPKLINQSIIARRAKIKPSYVNMILKGKRKCPRTPENLTKIKKAIIDTYGSVVKKTS